MHMEIDTETFVLKRDGSTEEVSFDKILTRVKNLCQSIAGGKELNINAGQLVLKIMDQFHSGISTSKIDELVAQQCASAATTSRDHGKLAARITVSSLHKNTETSFLTKAAILFGALGTDGSPAPLVSDAFWGTVNKNSFRIEQAIDYMRDYNFDYFGMKTLERSYLLKCKGKIVERPQDMWMRVAIGIHGNNIAEAIHTYNLLSNKYFTHATPTLYNAGTPVPQLSSCYLLGMEDDSILGIFNTLKDCAMISKWAGGIGLHIHNVRGKGTHIRGTNGTSNGIVPMLRVYDMTARYVDQGGGKRAGSFAVYMEPWHSDIECFLDLKKNHGDEESRARDLFYGLWIPDAFMNAVETNSTWALFCPEKCPGLQDATGAEFSALYDKYVQERRYEKIVPARELWYRILDSQMETGTPYLLYKDSANAKSNQQHLGTIKSSNLCTEIIEYSDANETAVCNLSSICLPRFVGNDKQFHHEDLHSVVKTVVRNLNKVIDVNFYPTYKTELSNLRHRPIGLGVQGLADTFACLGYAFTDSRAKALNIDIFETIYHAAAEASIELAEERELAILSYLATCPEHVTSDPSTLFATTDPICREYVSTLDVPPTEVSLIRAEVVGRKKWLGAYATFEGSPASEGKFQFDLWGVAPSNRFNWGKLRARMVQSGMRNSLLVAPMPTASTAQIMGNNECFEPFTSNVYTRRTLAGEFLIVNKHLMRELEAVGIWNVNIKNRIVAAGGSVQDIEEIPAEIREKYKTVWETSMKDIIDMAADRAPYICQSQSMNLWIEEPNYNNLTKMHFYAWKKGLKTGMYYLRRKAAASTAAIYDRARRSM